MVSALASCNADGMINVKILCLRPRWLKSGATSLFQSCDPIGIDFICQEWHHKWHHWIPKVKMIECYTTCVFHHVMPMVSVLASCDATDIVNGIIEFLRSRQSKWGATWLLQCDAIGINISIIWCRKWCSLCHWIPYVKAIKMRCNMNFSSCDTIGISISNRWCQ